ncbi:MAG: hypothetical protein ACI935_001063 [Moritella dasanensis]|jgi:hypothetical protein
MHHSSAFCELIRLLWSRVKNLGIHLGYNGRDNSKLLCYFVDIQKLSVNLIDVTKGYY